MPLRDPLARRVVAIGALAVWAVGAALGANLAFALCCGFFIVIQTWRIFNEPRA
jgi:hypothetical protein